MSTRRAALLGLAAALLVPAPAQAASAPKVDQLVVFPSGKTKQRYVSTEKTSVTVSGRSCAVPRGTAIAGLARSKVAQLGLKDFGSCSNRTADASGIFVRSIGSDVNKGERGWVYKAGRRAGTAGGADPTGPFGKGPLKNTSRVTWFYCVKATDCQDTLEVTADAVAGGDGRPALRVIVRGYDDNGKGSRVAGATVHIDSVTAVTGADGSVTVPLAPGIYDVYAEKEGLVRSFPESVKVI